MVILKSGSSWLYIQLQLTASAHAADYIYTGPGISDQGPHTLKLQQAWKLKSKQKNVQYRYATDIKLVSVGDGYDYNSYKYSLTWWNVVVRM